MDPQELLWRKFAQDVDLYKFYLEISVKAALFAFGITGALASYFFSTEAKDVVVYSLIFPLILNLGFFILFRASVKASTEMMRVHERMAQQIEGVDAYDMNPLPSVCQLLAYMYALASVGLSIMIAVYIFYPTSVVAGG